MYEKNVLVTAAQIHEASSDVLDICNCTSQVLPDSQYACILSQVKELEESCDQLLVALQLDLFHGTSKTHRVIS